MRRDVYIENDSDGLSVIAAAALSAVIEDGRMHDERFVEAHQALLLQLHGDDSPIVRIVAGEELRDDEREQWIAHVTWRIDTPDGRLLVAGGFDPTILEDWRDAGEPDADSESVAVVAIEPGSWRVDVYAHAASLTGVAIMCEQEQPIGTLFRAAYPGRAFPQWLVDALDYYGEDDPGHESIWEDVDASIENGSLEVDEQAGESIGYLIHLTPFAGQLPPMPDGAWFEWDEGRRMPDPFPLGVRAYAPAA